MFETICQLWLLSSIGHHRGTFSTEPLVPSGNLNSITGRFPYLMLYKKFPLFCLSFRSLLDFFIFNLVESTFKVFSFDSTSFSLLSLYELSRSSSESLVKSLTWVLLFLTDGTLSFELLDALRVSYVIDYWFIKVKIFVVSLLFF